MCTQNLNPDFIELDVGVFDVTKIVGVIRSTNCPSRMIFSNDQQAAITDMDYEKIVKEFKRRGWVK